MKQTAVEWLVELVNSDCLNSTFIRQDIIEQAKQMEKQHLYNFYVQGGVDAIMEADRNVEQYYNETFKSE